MSRAGCVRFVSPILALLQVLILSPILLVLILGNEMASLMYSSHIHAAYMTARKLVDESNFHLLPRHTVENSTFHVLPQATRADDFDLLLSVPFYIYEELNWLDTGYRGNKTFHEILRNQEKKHQEDLHFYNAALRHPMRTRRPEEAKLFVVPFLSSIVIASLIYKDPATLCVNTTCGKDLLASLDQSLGNSKWFQRNEGKDHLATITYFGFAHQFVKGRRQYKNLMKCHVIQWGEEKKVNIVSRLAFNTFYVGTKCPLSPKTSDLAMVARDKPRARFQSRRDICRWVKGTNYSMPICGAGQQCPALAEARFGFHVRGDTYGANRLLDTLLSGTVPIFTHQEQYDLMPEWIDWSQLSYFAPVTNKTTFLSSLHTILEDKEVSARKLKNVVKNSDLFDWETPIPFDTYMYMLQAHLWPELRRNESRYSALVLPPVLVPSDPVQTTKA
jgi:Exostosin family